jgi:Fe-S-cluster-containing dehydrogenase component
MTRGREKKIMAYVVTGACVDCVYTSCVDECPVAAFHERPTNC